MQIILDSAVPRALRGAGSRIHFPARDKSPLGKIKNVEIAGPRACPASVASVLGAAESRIMVLN